MSRYRPPVTPGSRFITAAGHARLTAELDQLWRVERPRVTQAVSEAAAQGDASTKLTKSSNAESGVSNVLGLLPALKRSNPELDANNLLSFLAKSEFNGNGVTARKGELSGHIAVRITREMPNGDLFIEGTKVLLLNHEEYHLYVSGLVRPLDISRSNTLHSSRIADAQIEFTGRGDVDQTTSQGWLAKAFSAINPF